MKLKFPRAFGVKLTSHPVRGAWIEINIFAL